MIRALLAIPFLFVLVQDDASLQELVRRLDDNDLEVREKALRDLIQAGPRALEPLRKALSSESAEVRARATEAIRAIELARRSLEACPEFKPFALKRTGTIGDLLDELARLRGVRFEVPPGRREMKASVDARTLAQALDQICSGPEALTYAAGDDGLIRFSSEVHPRGPALYFEFFRIFATGTEALRKSDFKETTVTARISLHTTWESILKPLKRVRYEFELAKDDAGREVEIVPASDLGMLRMGGGGVWIAGFGEEPDSGGPQDFEVKGLAADAKAVAIVKGTAHVSFPLSRTEVSFEDPVANAVRMSGDISMKLKSVKKNRILITFGKSTGDVTALRDEILGRIDPGSLRAVDEHGKEHAGDIGPALADPAGGMIVMGGPGQEPSRTAVLQAVFPTHDGSDIKRFSFQFSDALFEKAVPFEIRNIPLP